jgi:hypothetical protein
VRGGPVGLSTVAALGVLLGLALLASVGPATATVVETPSRLRLEVLLTTSPSLPDISRRALISETERIWRRELVEIRWPAPAGGLEREDAPLRALVITRGTSPASGDERWPVAELKPHARDRALAIASITGAQRVISEATGRFDLPAIEDYRLGLVLGRALAHEVGHFLLGTTTHAQEGLMRASVEASEFAAIGLDTFKLDTDASQWIRRQLHTGQPVIGALRASGFTYARR